MCWSAVPERQQQRGWGVTESLDVGTLSEVMVSQANQDPEQIAKMEGLGNALGVPVSVIKSMVYKKRGLVNMAPEEVKAKVAKIAEIVEVSQDQAREMAIIQPNLLIETEKQSEALRMGIRVICYELKAPKEEVVGLILKHPSVLHGREMHLSPSDIAHLAMLRQPRGRVMD